MDKKHISGNPSMYHHTGEKYIVDQIKKAFDMAGVSKARHRYANEAVIVNVKILKNGGGELNTTAALWYDGNNKRVALHSVNKTPMIISLTKSGMNILSEGEDALSKPSYMREVFNKLIGDK